MRHVEPKRSIMRTASTPAEQLMDACGGVFYVCVCVFLCSLACLLGWLVGWLVGCLFVCLFVCVCRLAMLRVMCNPLNLALAGTQHLLVRTDPTSCRTRVILLAFGPKLKEHHLLWDALGIELIRTS